MIARNRYSVICAALASALLLLTLGGCGRNGAAPAPAEAVSEPGPVRAAESAEAEAGRQDGERFEELVILEGMEEPVGYEHVRNETIGFEMDYDYSLFERQDGSDRVRFVSRYDDPENPQNYLEVTAGAADADTVSAAVSRFLSNEYEIIPESCTLGRAGGCIRIDASKVKGGGGTPDLLQTVYIIPAGNGCRVAAAHCGFESAEGFGRRFRYMMDTFAVLDSHTEKQPTGTWQTASMAYEADGSMYPEYHVRFTDTEVLYGHMRDEEFVPNRADTIIFREETAAGGLRIRAESSEGVQYSYQSCEDDENILEFYETWREEDFPDMYRGGASLSRCG